MVEVELEVVADGVVGERPGSESHWLALAEVPVTECTVSGPVQYQVTCSPRSMWISGSDHW